MKTKALEHRKKQIAKKLPDMPSNDIQKNALEYVSLIYEGVDKEEAYKQVFPHRYKNHAEFAKMKKKPVRAIVMSHANTYEQGEYVGKLFNLGRDNYWKRFIHKKTRLLDKAFDIVMDDDEDRKVQLGYMKVFLDNVPDIKEEINVVVKHQLSQDDEFMRKLQERKALLLSSVDEVIDIECEDV